MGLIDILNGMQNGRPAASRRPGPPRRPAPASSSATTQST